MSPAASTGTVVLVMMARCGCWAACGSSNGPATEAAADSSNASTVTCRSPRRAAWRIRRGWWPPARWTFKVKNTNASAGPLPRWSC